ncbi:hypothetical protein [Clostridium sp.]|uniref:hypothetical protein n=1 Tax=Clostridium sp. TaxID=1506 RepID=UPI00284F67D2|nr:hypothetical protein [Clostridium sp.]MDR3594165.1 hypothetical protein [Clostridium sp.]
MLEQKLFFTRNGEYTVWEKIQFLKEASLKEIINYIYETGCRIESMQNNSLRKGIIYKLCTSKEYELIKKDILELIDKHFYKDNAVDKADFNGLLFKIDFSYMDISNAYKALQKLNEIKEEYDIDNPKFYIFLRKNEECIDIRLNTTKINEYKDNFNEQFMNTELRLYFKLGLILMTDYSEYTHIKSIKTKLIDDIQKLLTNTSVRLEPYKLSDMTLRVLLKKSKKYSSKFKFSIDGIMDVDFNVSENINDDPLMYDSLREFYDKHLISVIKISMSDNEDKYITVDGEKGKLISRSKNMEVKDINEFIELLSYVIKYDYLNNNYMKNIKNMAKDKLIGPTTNKMAQIESLYLEIENNIKKNVDEDPDNAVIIRNTFFYCLIKGVMVNQYNEMDFNLNDEIVSTLAKVLCLDKKLINSLFNYVINLARNPDNNDLLETFDKFINSKGEFNVSKI